MYNAPGHPHDLFEPIPQGVFHVPPLPEIQPGPHLEIQAVFATINSERPAPEAQAARTA